MCNQRTFLELKPQQCLGTHLWFCSIYNFFHSSSLPGNVIFQSESLSAIWQSCFTSSWSSISMSVMLLLIFIIKLQPLVCLPGPLDLHIHLLPALEKSFGCNLCQYIYGVNKLICESLGPICPLNYCLWYSLWSGWKIIVCLGPRKVADWNISKVSIGQSFRI